MFDEVEHSPDGRIRIDYAMDEWGMNKWNRDPTVTDTATSAQWLTLRGGYAETQWGANGQFVVRFQCPSYYGTKFEFHFDAADGTVRLGVDGRAAPVAEAQAMADAALAPIYEERRKAAAARTAASEAERAKERDAAMHPAPATDAPRDEQTAAPRDSGAHGTLSYEQERRFTGMMMIAIGLGVAVVYIIGLMMP